MRLMLFRGVVFGAVVLPCAAAATAQPPAALPDKLKADTAALAADRVAAESTSTERAKLQADLRRLIEKIDRIPSGPGPMAPPVVPPPVAKGKDDGAAPVDRLRAATNHVRDNQYEVALAAFRLIDLQKLTPDDRAFARYMTAACLRRVGRPAEALPIYREVADAGDDTFVASSHAFPAGSAGSKVISPVPLAAASLLTGNDELARMSVQKFSDKLYPVKISTATVGSGIAIEMVVEESAERAWAFTKTVTATSRESDSAQKKASPHAPDRLNRTSCVRLGTVEVAVATPFVVEGLSIDAATFVLSES